MHHAGRPCSAAGSHRLSGSPSEGPRVTDSHDAVHMHRQVRAAAAPTGGQPSRMSRRSGTRTAPSSTQPRLPGGPAMDPTRASSARIHADARNTLCRLKGVSTPRIGRILPLTVLCARKLADISVHPEKSLVPEHKVTLGQFFLEPAHADALPELDLYSGP